MTSRQQAIRYGVWRLRTEALKDGVRFETGQEALGLMPGAIIRIKDSHRDGKRTGGRILGATGIRVDLDRVVKLESGKGYELAVMMDAKEEELTANGNASSLTLKGPLVNNDYRRARVQEEVNGVWIDREPSGFDAEMKAVEQALAASARDHAMSALSDRLLDEVLLVAALLWSVMT